MVCRRGLSSFHTFVEFEVCTMGIFGFVLASMAFPCLVIMGGS